MTLAIAPPLQYDQENESQFRQAVDRLLRLVHFKDGNLELGYDGESFQLIFTSASGTRIAIGLDSSSNLIATDVETGATVTILEYADINGAPQSLADLDATAAQELIDIRVDFVSADSALSSAYIAADAAVSSGAASARAALETTLRAEYQVADGAVQSGYIFADSVVAADAASARATLETTLRAEYQVADGGLLTQINDRVTTATYNNGVATLAAADAAEASARQALQATLEAADLTLQGNITNESSTRASETAANAASISSVSAQTINPAQNLFPHPSGFGNGAPASDLGWVSPADLVQAEWSFGPHYVANYVSGYSNGAFQFCIYVVNVPTSGDYTLSMDAFATNMQVQVNLQAHDSSGTFLGTSTFADFPSSGRLTLSYPSTPANTRQIWVVIRIPNQTTVGFSQLGFYKIKLEQGLVATTFTDEASAVSTAAVSSILQSAFIDANGNAVASIDLVADAVGGTPAIVQLRSGNGLQPVRIGGDTQIDGSLMVTGTIQTGAHVVGAISNRVTDINDADVAFAGSWTTVADATIVSTGGKIQVLGQFEVFASTGVNGGSVVVNARLVRDLVTVVRSTRVGSSQIQTNFEAGVGNVEQPTVFRGSATLIDEDEPAAGLRRYQLQVQVETATHSGIASDRFLAVREFKTE